MSKFSPYLFQAPLANFVALQLSNRFIVFVGGILIALGFMLSMNATSIVYLYFSYGGLVGRPFLYRSKLNLTRQKVSKTKILVKL